MTRVVGRRLDNRPPWSVFLREEACVRNMSTPLPVIAVDIDGTLFDVRRRYYRLYTEALADDSGVCISPSSYIRYIRKGLGHETLLQEKHQGFAFELWQRYRHQHGETSRYLRLDKLVTEMGARLENLRQHARLIALAERADPDTLRWQLERAAIAHLFDTIVCVGANADSGRKAEGLREYGCVLSIGDTEVDIDAARLAGCPSMSVSWGLRSRRFLAERTASVYSRANHLPADEAVRRAA